MKRSIILAAGAIGCLAIGSLVTGLAVATTSTTNPITLCVSSQPNNAVSTPGRSGQCLKGQTAIEVASAADLDALAAQVAALAAPQHTVVEIAQAIALTPGEVRRVAAAVVCPTGYHATGGGYQLNDSGALQVLGSYAAVVTSNPPNPPTYTFATAGFGEATAWVVDVRNTAPIFVDENILLHAECASP